jgi:hypothetical protein
MTKVLDIAYLLGSDQDLVFFKQESRTVCDLCCELISRHHAKTVAIWFFGGPPRAEEWFEGTLYQFVVDRIMRELLATSPGIVIRMLGLSKTKPVDEETVAV